MTRGNPTNKRTCSVKGCGRKHKARGFCQQHYHENKPTCPKAGCDRRVFANGLCWTHDRETKDRCAVEGCDKLHYANGLCERHDREAKGTCSKKDCDKLHFRLGLCLWHYRRTRPTKTCTVEGCDKQTRNSLCAMHYNREKRANGDPCSIEGCDTPEESLGLCPKHYQRVWNHGDPHFNLHEANGPVPHVVYLFWDADDNCLYVGLTVNVKTRHGSHAREKRWWDKVDRIDQIDCASRDEADALETKLIVELRPRYNKKKKPPNCQARRT